MGGVVSGLCMVPLRDMVSGFKVVSGFNETASIDVESGLSVVSGTMGGVAPVGLMVESGLEVVSGAKRGALIGRVSLFSVVSLRVRLSGLKMVSLDRLSGLKIVSLRGKVSGGNCGLEPAWF